MTITDLTPGSDVKVHVHDKDIPFICTVAFLGLSDDGLTATFKWKGVTPTPPWTATLIDGQLFTDDTDDLITFP